MDALDLLAEQLTEMRDKLAAAESRAETLKGEAAQHRAAADTAVIFGTMAKAEIDDLRVALNKSRAEQQQLTAQLAARDERIEGLLNSRSWKLTGPLRRIRR